MADPADIRGWQRLSDDVTTSGRLEEHDVARLAALGVQQVINLALDSHPDALADEGGKLAAAGIGYTHIPVPFDAPNDTHFAAFRAVLEQAPKPLHVHCIMNWRVSAFFYRLHRDVLGMAEDEARALMQQQWEPDRSDRPEWAVWAQFIAPRAV
ncbi:protein tyrosine phosphatase family protein [Novosphingobium sp.]|uniref:protein tyrosine phosphatase family protein n=1 Tax=Novosphingobium sp. TaxID=1874826 RepID=UPI001D496A8E|nr:protein tyrosine phosphatase family protein [Novosphingobium sp.]MBX9664991.1 protein tyrosine phosphatase family protein [Novosphingobium sp.]